MKFYVLFRKVAILTICLICIKNVYAEGINVNNKININGWVGAIPGNRYIKTAELDSKSAKIICVKVCPDHFKWDKMWRNNDGHGVCEYSSIVSIKDPVYSDAYIKSWVASRVPKFFNFNEKNFDTRFNKETQYFTMGGLNCIMSDDYLLLPKKEDFKDIDLYSLHNVTSSAVMNGDTKIQKKFVLRGVYKFSVDVPVKITISGMKLDKGKSAHWSESKNYIISVLITRQDHGYNGNLIAIQEISKRIIK